MKPGRLPLRAQSRPLCQLCEFVSRQSAQRRSFLAASTVQAPSIRRVARHHGVAPLTQTRTLTTMKTTKKAPQKQEEAESARQNLDQVLLTLQQAEERIQEIVNSGKVEDETPTLQVLNALEWVAEQSDLIRKGRQPVTVHVRQSSASAILSLGGDESTAPSKTTTRSQTNDHLPTSDHLSQLAEDLLRHPNVFISPSALSKYVDIQWALDRVHKIPDMFALYAHKPVPELGSSPPKFSKPSPKSFKQAIPTETAEKALRAAIGTKDLALAMNVIDTTYCSPAWKRYKILTKLGPPGTLAAITPLALYMIAQEASVYSSYIDPWTFKMYAFAGLFTYVTCTGTLGFVAMTTWNDHFERVVWRPGIPLTERWLREDERAALDKVACAWGFKEKWRRGDEEGEEWEALREWIYLRGMILDKSDLLEGMNPPSGQ
ncbi:hypothetical protein EJ04DRAFT_492110 [Polyplosphaeria fusca]|uniref:Uncharacterized protein n=1 Tax=Polyplosphaeria fusca TaxID=682080 RepID=A0A9P4R1C5_9PLEO|nr:hypothetical protein EJ04DRAFT_492110 [Polyplosphaeria fusca]